MALNLYFKPCCIECEHADVDVQLDTVAPFVGEVVEVVNVKCSHMDVCQFYGNDTNPPIANTDFGRRQI